MVNYKKRTIILITNHNILEKASPGIESGEAFSFAKQDRTVLILTC